MLFAHHLTTAGFLILGSCPTIYVYRTAFIKLCFTCTYVSVCIRDSHKMNSLVSDWLLWNIVKQSEDL